MAAASSASKTRSASSSLRPRGSTTRRRLCRRPSRPVRSLLQQSNHVHTWPCPHSAADFFFFFSRIVYWRWCAGSVVIIHGSVVHRSSANHSDKSRIIYTFHLVEGGPGYIYDEHNW